MSAIELTALISFLRLCHAFIEVEEVENDVKKMRHFIF